MELTQLKTKIRSFIPVNDLIPSPYLDSVYQRLFNENKLRVRKKSEMLDIDKHILDWIDHLALITQVTVKKNALDWSHGYYLYYLISRLFQNNEKKINIFESGTARGFSSIVMVRAALDLGLEPTLTTVDIIDHHKKRYWNSIYDINGRRSRSELLRDYSEYCKYINFLSCRSSSRFLSQVNQNRIDFAFLDGAHTYSDLKKELEYVIRRNIGTNYLVLDDVTNRFPGVEKAVSEICNYKSINVEIVDRSRGLVLLNF